MQRVLHKASHFKPAPRYDRLSYALRLSSATSLSSPADSTILPEQVPAKGASKEHNDLPSFLSYASRVGLRPTTTTYVGTHYEYTVASCLRRLGFSLTRVGGVSDLGIDLLGDWTLPTFPTPLKVLMQCKALNRRLSPHVARELKGAFVGAPAGWRGPDVVGVLTTPKSATKGVQKALAKSKLPLCFMKISLEGRVEQCLWNAAASEKGLEGVDVTLRYSLERAAEVKAATQLGVDTHGVAQEIVLTQKGRILSTDVADDIKA
ncbi:MAG: hypothetical protein M1835_004787 [Candelina submexicana]|nr:MAG: hypothetical protein M1835_004787 [Candelina submexicana]